MDRLLGMAATVSNPQEEFFWRDLIRRIAKGRVVPVLGRGLLQVRYLRDTSAPDSVAPLGAPLGTLVARRALASVGVPREIVRSVKSPDDAVAVYLKSVRRDASAFYGAVAEAAENP